MPVWRMTKITGEFWINGRKTEIRVEQPEQRVYNETTLNYEEVLVVLKVCKKCGKEYPEALVFCEECGGKLEPAVDMSAVKDTVTDVAGKAFSGAKDLADQINKKVNTTLEDQKKKAKEAAQKEIEEAQENSAEKKNAEWIQRRIYVLYGTMELAAERQQTPAFLHRGRKHAYSGRLHESACRKTCSKQCSCCSRFQEYSVGSQQCRTAELLCLSAE